MTEENSNGTGVLPQQPQLVAVPRPAPEDFRGTAALQLLWDHRSRLLRWAIRGLALSIVVALLIPTYYSSSARIMPPTPDSTLGLAALSAMGRVGESGLGMMAGSFLGIRSTGALFMGIMHSNIVEDAIIDRFKLMDLYSARLPEDARKKLEHNTTIVEDRQSGIITVTVTDRSPQRASEMADAYVEELNKRLAQVNTSAAHKERVFIEQQLKETKQTLDETSKTFSEFASKNTAIDIKEQGKAMVEGAARLQGELIAAQSELKGLEQIYMPRDIRVRTLRARVTELQSQLQKLNDAGVDDQTSATPGDTTSYPSIRKLPLLGLTYFDLYRQTKIQETVFEILNQQYQLSKIQEAKELPNARVFDPPSVPRRKAGPLRTIIVLVGLMLSLLCGSAWILGEQSWNEMHVDDPRKKLTLQVWSSKSVVWVRRSTGKAASPILGLIRRITNLFVRPNRTAQAD
ncbi:MAG TPA: lipopolysaccharide biosynthesis protein [Terriglobales bacterium]|jgi:capsule polysaccharide export protein KpsE/RkpR